MRLSDKKLETPVASGHKIGEHVVTDLVLRNNENGPRTSGAAAERQECIIEKHDR